MGGKGKHTGEEYVHVKWVLVSTHGVSGPVLSVFMCLISSSPLNNLGYDSSPFCTGVTVRPREGKYSKFVGSKPVLSEMLGLFSYEMTPLSNAPAAQPTPRALIFQRCPSASLHLTLGLVREAPRTAQALLQSRSPAHRAQLCAWRNSPSPA